MWSRAKNVISILAVHSFTLLGLWTFAQAQPMLGDALVVDANAGTSSLGALFSVVSGVRHE